mmetsp:Transcript_27019/g.59309  ORF Transcript_27019/g.59309 Transcript_27019/m.59309 type:complete len:241 (+) Transcript_27019:133-855(+)
MPRSFRGRLGQRSPAPAGATSGAALAMRELIAARSTLPPQRITPTRRSSGNFSWKAEDTATATPTPAEGSMASFMRSQTARVAEAISSSSTRKISSTRSLTSGKVLLPSVVLSPSAMVWTGPSWSRIFPAFLLRKASLALAGSAPMILHPGSKPFTAVAMPPMRPPPPTGTITASRAADVSWSQSSPACSTSSRPAVPWPLITSTSLYGCTMQPFCSSTTRCAAAWRLAVPGSQKTIRAP